MKRMQFGFFGINYKRAQLDVRDKTAFTDMRKAEFFQRAEEGGIEQCMILSTCNRSEVYFFYEEERQAEKLREAYQEMFSEVDLEPYLAELEGKEAIAYLFRTAAGLESLVLGEDQILGQVREAIDFSRTMGYSKKELNKIVRDAVTCAKKIKTELKISEIPLSVSYIGIQKLDALCGVKGKKVLVIGSGKTAALSLRYLYEYGAGHITVCSRTSAHAKELKEEFANLDTVLYEERYEVLKECEIVVSATASPHLVIRREEIPQQPKHPVAFLDLAAPRDIDTGLSEEPWAELMNLDTLYETARENQKERENLVQKSRQMIEEAVEETCTWLLQSHVDATIGSLQSKCSAIVEDSYEYLNRKMELSKREQKILKKVLNASLQRLLREPIQELKHLETREKQEEYEDFVKKLFQI